MNFVRKKKRGQSGKIRRTWFAKEGYRITWRREVFGVQIPARFQAAVRVEIPGYNSEQPFLMWDFVSKRRLYKTLNAAQDDCERHQQLWLQACEANGPRALHDIFGKCLPGGIPVWVKKKINRKAYAVLLEERRAQKDDECDLNPNDLPGVLPATLSNTSSVPSPGPVSPVANEDGNLPAGVQSVTEAEKEPSKPARRRTAKPSKGTTRKTVNTKGSSKRGRPRSKGSRKGKSKPSKN